MPTDRAARRRRGVGLVPTFGLVSLVLVVALGFILGARLQSTVRQRALSDAVRLADVTARVGITPLLTPADLQRDFVPLDAARVGQLDSALRTVSASGIVRIKIWNAQHWIVYSDNSRLIGRWFAADDELADSLRGESTSEVTDLRGAEEMEERDFGQLLSVYVPLRVDANGHFTANGQGTIIGAFEVYLPYKPIAQQIASDTRTLYVALVIGLLVLYVALFRLVAGASRMLRRSAAENERLARVDPLTGLANRVSFGEHVDDALAKSPAGLAVVLLDLDRFQEINDTLGHSVGDEVLAIVGERLQMAFPSAVAVARLGGDEFAIAVPLAAGESTWPLLDRTTAALHKPAPVRGLNIAIAASIGAAVSPDDGADADSLLRRADVAMYYAKRTRAGVMLYSTAIDHHSPERLELAAEVRDAIAQSQLFLVYQPKLDLADGSVHGVEALVRWRHPTRGVVPPGEFLPIVENMELIRPLTYYVLDAALDQLAAWHADGLPMSIAVNLSARLAEDPVIAEVIAHKLRQRGLPPQALEIELTESALVERPERLAAVLRHLHDDIGVGIAIDDFGTGYASLAYLTSFPVDVLKIDQSFVADVCTNPQHEAVVRFTNELARSFGFEVVAEGVEDAATMDRLVELGVHLIQGFYVARPTEAGPFTDWLRAYLAQFSLAAGAR